VKNSKETSAIYQQIIDAWEKPEYQRILKGNIELPIAASGSYRWQASVAPAQLALASAFPTFGFNYTINTGNS
jgi:hypothetical protein